MCNPLHLLEQAITRGNTAFIFSQGSQGFLSAFKAISPQRILLFRTNDSEPSLPPQNARQKWRDYRKLTSVESMIVFQFHVSAWKALLYQELSAPLKSGNLHPLESNLLGIQCCDICQAPSTAIRWNPPFPPPYPFLPPTCMIKTHLTIHVHTDSKRGT